MNRLHLWSIVLVASPCALVAQVQVPDPPICGRCSIEVRSLVSIGTVDGPGSLGGTPNQVATDMRGRYWIVDGHHLPMVFAPSGEFVGEVGRRGPGPGEFLSAAAILRAGPDSMFILDPAAQRGTVIGPDMKPARVVSMAPLAVISARAIAWSQDIVLHALAFSRERIGWPLHRVGLSRNDIEVLHSFGPGGGELRQPGSAAELLTTLATPGPGSIWSSDIYAYRLAEWSTDGTLARLLERRPSWFPARSRDWIGNPTTPPPPRVASIDRDDAGLIWVFIHVPARDWQSAWSDHVGGSEASVLRVQPDRLYRTMVEVIDVEAERVLVRSMLDAYVVNALPGRRVAIYGEPDGIPQIEIADLLIIGLSR